MRLLLTFLVSVTVLCGTELEFDKVYSGPKKLTVSSLGASMGLPPHWNAVAKQGEGLLLFQDDTNDTIVMRSKTMNSVEAIRYLNEVHYLGDDRRIFPQEHIMKVSSRIYRRNYSPSGAQHKRSVLVYIILGPQERAVAITADYDVSKDSAFKVLTMNIAQALVFIPTRQLQNALDDLEMRLKGAHIVYVKDAGTYDEKRELWLCSDRRYLLKEEHTLEGGMSRIQEQKSGTWSVESSRLILQGNNGQEQTIDITREDKALLFDGHRSYELANHHCR
ncbi:hypothetical protein [Sulfurimonas sp. HSL3-7]|uniref:hypothetical protein n=1 Tax=Sulfonitrofixus jiaomeiensis TaxID=3131938 RepID=UPI0031F9CFD2